MKKTLMAAAALCVILPIIPAAAHDYDGGGYGYGRGYGYGCGWYGCRSNWRHHRYHEELRDTHRRAHREGFDSDEEHEAYHRGLRDAHEGYHEGRGY